MLCKIPNLKIGDRNTADAGGEIVKNNKKTGDKEL
jgi:hypothetical protein